MHVSRTKAIRGLLVAAIIGSSLATIAGTGAQAATGCVDRSVKPAFQQWGDNNQYFLATNGDFENGTNDWTLSGASTVRGEQEPWAVNGPGQQALSLSRSGSAQFTMCVKSNEDSLRFFWKSLGASANLRIDITVANMANVNVVNRTSLTTAGITAWQVGQRVQFPQVRDANGQLWITVKFSNSGNTPIVIDDVMVDPWSTN
jgi:hypothetical protein